MERSEVLDIIEQRAKKLSNSYVKYSKLAMIELERNNISAFALMRNEPLRVWWEREIQRVTRRETQYQEALRIYELKRAAYERLTADERRLLGLRKPTRPKKSTG
jgi:hypothetical protein